MHLGEFGNVSFGGIYSGKEVLVTGHTGFKGSPALRVALGNGGKGYRSCAVSAYRPGSL